MAVYLLPDGVKAPEITTPPPGPIARDHRWVRHPLCGVIAIPVSRCVEITPPPSPQIPDAPVVVAGKEAWVLDRDCGYDEPHYYNSGAGHLAPAELAKECREQGTPLVAYMPDLAADAPATPWAWVRADRRTPSFWVDTKVPGHVRVGVFDDGTYDDVPLHEAEQGALAILRAVRAARAVGQAGAP